MLVHQRVTSKHWDLMEKKQGFFHDISAAPPTASHGLAFEVVEILRQKVDRGWTALGKNHFPKDSEEIVIP